MRQTITIAKLKQVARVSGPNSKTPGSPFTALEIIGSDGVRYSDILNNHNGHWDVGMTVEVEVVKKGNFNNISWPSRKNGWGQQQPAQDTQGYGAPVEARQTGYQRVAEPSKTLQQEHFVSVNKMVQGCQRSDWQHLQSAMKNIEAKLNTLIETIMPILANPSVKNILTPAQTIISTYPQVPPAPRPTGMTQEEVRRAAEAKRIAEDRRKMDEFNARALPAFDDEEAF